MARRRNKSISVGWVFIMVIIVAGIAASITYIMASRSDQVITPNKDQGVKPPVVTEIQDTRTVTIYLPESTPKRFYLVPVSRKTDMRGDILDVAMEVLLGTTDEPGEAGALIPKGTKMLAPVKVEGDVATVNLSSEFVDHFSGGSTQESLVLNSIAHTVVANSGGKVENVQILVEGETVETLGGHFGLEEPIAADSTLLKTG